MLLHNYQETCVKYLRDRPSAGLFLDPGLGKTIIALTALKDLIALGDVKKILVLATKRIALETWSREIAKFNVAIDYGIAVGTPKHRLSELGHQMTITNYENLKWIIEQGFDYDTVIVDESSHFKDSRTKRFRLMRSIRKHIKRIYILTGSPAPNSLIDLWPQMWLLDTGARLSPSINRYRSTYFEGESHYGGVVYKYRLRPGADKIIYSKIDDIVISMRSKDYLVLPPRVENTIEIAFDKELANLYKKFVMEKILELKDGQITAENAGVLTGKLCQFTSGAVYYEGKNYKTLHNQKVEALKEIVEELQGEPVLVFYQFTSEVERIKEIIPEAKHLDEIKLNDWDKGLVPVLLAHPKSAGHGLNLQAGGHTIVWFSPTWSLEQYTQANARLDRQGQTHPVEIHHLVVKQTIDEVVMQVIQRKSRGQEALMNALISQISQMNRPFSQS